MFGQAAGVNQFDPRTYRFPVFGFDVADLGRDAVFHAGTWSSLAGGARLILPPPLAGLRDSSCGGTEGTGDGGGSISCCRWWPSSLGDRLVRLRMVTLRWFVKENEYGGTMDMRAGASTMSCESTHCCGVRSSRASGLSARIDGRRRPLRVRGATPRTPTEDDTH